MFNKEFPQSLIPPSVPAPNLYPPMDEFDFTDQTQGNIQRICDTLKMNEAWLRSFAAAFYRYAEANNRVVNGQIEFPTPEATVHTGNLKVSYVQCTFAKAGSGDTPIFAIPHGYGDGTTGTIPRGWFAMRNSNNGVSGNVRFTDQVISSDSPSPFPATGPVGPVSVTVTDAVTLTSSGGGTNAWAGNGVWVGDEIKVHGVYDPGVTGSNAAGETFITLSGAPAIFPTVGWWIRYAAVAGAEYDKGWHLVTAVDTANNHVTVTPSFITLHNTRALEIMPWDRKWRKITAVGTGVNPTLTLESPGTEVNVGLANCGYVVHRPPDATYIWVRFLGASFIEQTFCIY